MFSKRISFSGLRRLAPRAKAPQVTRAAGPQAWNLRRAAVGLEVRGNDLYAACVRAGWNRRWVAATAVIENWAQLSAEDLRARLADVASGADDPLIVLGLPRRELMVRHLELPAAAARQLDSVLQLQLGLYKPSDDEEVYWDAAVVEHGEKLGIDLALVPTTRVQELASLLRAARYPIARVTTAQFAAMDWVLRVRGATEADGRLMLVQGHGSEVELAILDGPRCVFTRSFPLPANTDAGEHIANQARQALASLRGARDGAFTVLIAGDGCEQWRDALQPLGSVEHLGRYAQTDALADPADAQREEFWGALALALNGLSWTGDYRLNLLPRELRPARRRWQNVPTYALLTANVLLLAALAGRAPLQRHILLKRYEYELSRVETQASLVERQVKKTERVQQRLDAMRQFRTKGRQPLDALSAMTQKLPPDAWVNMFTYRQEKVDISGQAKSAAALVPALKLSPAFEDVQLRGALTREPTGAERFQMQLKLRASR